MRVPEIDAVALLCMLTWVMSMVSAVQSNLLDTTFAFWAGTFVISCIFTVAVVLREALHEFDRDQEIAIMLALARVLPPPQPTLAACAA